MEGVGGKKKGCRCRVRVRVEETHSYVQIPGHPVQSVQSSPPHACSVAALWMLSPSAVDTRDVPMLAWKST